MKTPVPVLVTGASALAGVFFAIQPINSTLTRAAFLASLAALFASLLVLTWRVRPVRIALLLAVAAFAGLFLLPGRPVDAESLRASYVSGLTHYTDAPYVWGGEAGTGIDCSGLPRRAYRDALFREGLLTLNGALLREAASQWWFDVSASALAASTRDSTTPLGLTGTLRKLPVDTLRPGDIAVTRSGIHCLVYLRDRDWIQADPGDGHVATYDARTTPNAWFDSPVSVHRWTLLK